MSIRKFIESWNKREKWGKFSFGLQNGTEFISKKIQKDSLLSKFLGEQSHEIAFEH